MSTYILAIDQGTTSSRAILFDDQQSVVAISQKEFTQHFPASGMVEHDPEEIWESVVETCRGVIAKAGVSVSSIAAIGITNQRETTVIWEKESGKPIHNAIVWQDRRTVDICNTLVSNGHSDEIAEKTGLLPDPYFSGTKVSWILDNVDGARKKAAEGDLLFGTIDCFLLWRLTGGKVHRTDATNASRTMLFNIHKHCWDEQLCEVLNVPMQILPEVADCGYDFGVTVEDLFGASIQITGMAGDQHAATMGQACFQPGMIKSTYGTGCFLMMNTGDNAIRSSNRLLTTIGYRLNGKTTFALEGSIFIAGASVQWLRDELNLIDDAAASGTLASDSDPSQKLILVPAFAGLGAPHWEPNVRGAIFGLTRKSGPREFARAALESVCFQTMDLTEALSSDFDIDFSENWLRVDGGMVASEWTMQCLADILGCVIERPTITETTALGAAWVAGMHIGVWPDQETFSKTWKLDKRFTSAINDDERSQQRAQWQAAIKATVEQSKSALAT